MQLFKSKRSKAAVAALAMLSVLGAACGDDSNDEAAPATEQNQSASTAQSGEAASANGVDTGAATLRAGLTDLLSEHLYLAALATGAALRGDTAGFEQFATALNGPTNSNTADLVAAIGSAYGPEVGRAFDGLWRSDKHIPQFVAYTQATAKGDKAAQDAAVTQLKTYAKEFGTTINSVNDKLPADVVEGAIVQHATELIAVINAQKAGDQPSVYSALRTAYGHMGHTAKALAGGTAAKFPDKFDGTVDSKASELRSGLNLLLREHVWLAASATGAALGGRMPQFEAVAAALNGPTNSNTADIVAAVGSVYGPDVQKAFDGLWRSEKHIPQFVAYTQAAAKGDQAGKDAAVAQMKAYAKEFGTTLNSVNDNLPADAVESAIVEHATTLLAVIDAQAAKDPAKAATTLRSAVGHMSLTAKAIAGGTVAKFPEKF
ncbi:MAG: hypothetical protein AB1679_04700 [Actinomycetota bacterium]|jgi:flagellar biosynthesis/type III secretory pathway protein FliH